MQGFLELTFFFTYTIVLMYFFLLDREHDYEITAAAGYCAHLVLILSQLLQLPLRFPIDYHGTPKIKIYDYSLAMNE